MAQINRQQLIMELSTVEPILVREATRVFEKEFFNPAVEKLVEDFENDNITKELDAASEDVSIDGFSGTIIGPSNDEARNLYAFIGFNEGDRPTDVIREYLDPKNPDGPSYKYIRGSQRDNLQFNFEIKGPNLDKIYQKTEMPWAKGLSWAKRIETGIPGLSKFLNKLGLKGSRSGGGIQVKNNLRTARFRPKRYLSKIINAFIKEFTG